MRHIKRYVIIIFIFCILSFCLADCQVSGEEKKTIPKVKPTTGNGNGVNTKVGSVKTTDSNGDSGTTNSALKINSNPTNASVFIDNKFKGYTPLFIPSIPCKAYTFELKKNGYQSKSFIYALSAFRAYTELNESLELAPLSAIDPGQSNQNYAEINQSREVAYADETNPKGQANTTRTPNSEHSSWPQISAELILAILSLLFGSGILNELKKYNEKRIKERKKKSDGGKALLSANLEEQKEGIATIRITNIGMATAKNYSILFNGKTRTGEHFIKTMPDQPGYSLPARNLYLFRLNARIGWKYVQR